MWDGTLFGLLAWASMLFTWTKMPQAIKKFSVNHPLITDLLTGIVTFLSITAITKSLAGVIACMVAGLLMELTMTLLRNGWFPILYTEKTHV